MNETIKRLMRGKQVPALMSIVFGIALIIARRSTMDVMIKITAVIIGLIGVGVLLVNLFGPIKDSLHLGMGVVAIIIGVLCWMLTDSLVDLFPILTGIGLILNGLSNLSTLSSPQENAGSILVIVFSVLMIAGGIFIAFHPAAVENLLMVYIGIGYIVNGLFDLIILYRMKEILLSK